MKCATCSALLQDVIKIFVNEKIKRRSNLFEIVRHVTSYSSCYKLGIFIIETSYLNAYDCMFSIEKLKIN